MTVAAPPSMPFGRPPRRIWTGAEFDQLVEQGMFDGQRVELIDGEILEMPPMNDPHAQAVQLATHLLISIFPATAATTRVQLPMRLGESRPLPDLAIVAGTPRQIVRHPETALLVIEVSDSTLDFDRDEKAKLYARNSLPEYWIVNLPGRCLEVHRSPVGGDADPRYGEIRVFSEADVIAPLAAPEAAIRVADLLP